MENRKTEILKKEIRIEAEARREQSSIAVTARINPRNVYKWLERALLEFFPRVSISLENESLCS